MCRPGVRTENSGEGVPVMTLGQQVLERLVARLGGTDQAAKALGISDTLVQHLLSGRIPVPDSVLLKAVDCLSEPEPDNGH
jgi:hypothetical protein